MKYQGQDILLQRFTKSHKPNKKFDANLLIDNERIRLVPFGEKGFEDYTDHKDIKRKELYLHRHSKRENWGDPLAPGFWSRWYLWNLPTKVDSESDLRKRFGL